MKKFFYVLMLLCFAHCLDASFPLPSSMLAGYRNKTLKRFADSYLLKNPMYKAVIDPTVKLPSHFNNLLLCGGCYCKKGVVGMIDREQQSINIAMYRLTDKDIIQALLRAQSRGVKLQLIVDKSSLETTENLQRLLLLSKKANSNVSVYESSDKSIMHLKLLLFGNQYKMLGSFNCTDSAARSNIEIMELAKNKKDVAFLKEFLHEVKKVSKYSQKRIKSK